MSSLPRAIVLVSGGLDSATTLAIAKRDGFAPYAMSFRYGQRHAIELAAAREVCRQIGVARHAVVSIDLRFFGGSALTDDLPVPKGRSPEEMATGIPVTYVPARNTIFLSYALAWAEVVGAHDIFLGVNALDYSGYPDCREEYLAAFERMANLATRISVEAGARMRVRAPLVALSKREIIAVGIALGVNYANTRSCYDPAPDGAACGACDSCQIRLKGFRDNGLPDPAPYQKPGTRRPGSDLAGARGPAPDG